MFFCFYFRKIIKIDATVVHTAVANGSYEAVKKLLGYKGEADAKDSNDNTPLHYAASLGRVELCNLLLAIGIPINIRNKKKMEPIHASILSDDIPLFEWFIQ